MEVLSLRWAANGLSEIGSSFCHVTLLVSGNEEEAPGSQAQPLYSSEMHRTVGQDPVLCSLDDP